MAVLTPPKWIAATVAREDKDLREYLVELIEEWDPPGLIVSESGREAHSVYAYCADQLREALDL